LDFSSIREADVRHIAEDAAIEWSFCNAILELSQQTISVDEKVKEGQQAWTKGRNCDFAGGCRSPGIPHSGARWRTNPEYAKIDGLISAGAGLGHRRQFG
jgi:hypothetical protein